MLTPILDVAIELTLESPGRRFDLSLQFSTASRRIALFGPSGAGKSATLHVLAGLLHPLRGHVKISGHTLFDAAQGINLPVRLRRVGMVFQEYALFPHMTVQQNLQFAVQRIGQPLAPQASERVEALLQQFGIASLRASFPKHLSGGQKQRVALARALAAQPHILLLDEPFAALDHTLRQRLRDELVDMLDAIQIPVVLVSHDLDDVQALTGEIICMEHGRVKN